MARRFPDHPRHWQHVARREFGRFITEIELIDGAGRHILWNARRHRKGLGPFSDRKRARTRTFTQHLNRPIALLFIVGASLFFAGSLMSLLGADSAFREDGVFFVGSIFFTAAAYVQYLQSINNSEDVHLANADGRWRPWAWQPDRIDFWVTATQFLGALFFNFNTYDSFASHTKAEELLSVWIPDIIGSILFMISGSLSVVEFNTRPIFWPRSSLQSAITVVNFWGCVFFMGSALLALGAILVPGGISGNLSLALTAAGAAAFFASSTLMLFEK